MKSKTKQYIKKIEKKENINLNKYKYGQYFTKVETISRLLNILNRYKTYTEDIIILEPSFGTGNFIKVLNDLGYKNIDGCEIDSNLTDNPIDFFIFPLEKKYDLIIGNPPFTKYNLKESYYYPKVYQNSDINPEQYLNKKSKNKTKEKIENVFLLKSMKHLKNYNSTIAFILPISFFIKNKNKEIKDEIIRNFSTVIIYQDKRVWFDYHIPCCFAIFTNTSKFNKKIILLYENDNIYEITMDITSINEELIPEVVFHKNNKSVISSKGHVLSNYISSKKVKYKKSYIDNNVSASNILNRTSIPNYENIENYKLAIVRVGNASVGRCGLIDIEKDILNDMFYVFDFKEEYKNNKQIKESICKLINQNQDYFKKITCRVGSKSIRKQDILDF